MEYAISAVLEDMLSGTISEHHFIGYSLPDDDVHITYLLKRSLAHLSASTMTVVEIDKCKRGLKENPVGSRYRILFSEDIDWHPEGMAEWLTIP